MKKILGIVLAFFVTAMAILTSAVFLKPVSAATGYKKTVATVTTVGSSKTISELTAKDEYKVRDSFYSLTDSSVNRMASEHFQIIWGNGDTTGTVNTEFVKGNLINLENIRAFYINELGMKDVTTSTTGAVSGKYKLNLYISATGLTKFTDDWAYMSADYEGFSYLFVAPGAMRVDEPSWVLPHELAHAFTYHQGGQVPGTWYESMANWFRDQYLGSTYYAYGDNVYGPTSDFFTPYMTSADCYVPHMLNWYDTWPIFLYITENPDNIDGLGLDLMHKILEEGDSSTSMYTTIEKFSGVSIKTILAGMSKRMATMDFERQDSYLKHLNEEALTVDGNYAKIYTTLNVADSQGYQSVPSDRAPMQTGFNIIPLTDADFSKGSINIDFVNTSTASEADFRATIVTANAANETRYSNTVSNGTASINLKGDETKAYLVVCATPDEIKDFTVDYNSKATDASTRYTYKVKITYSDKKTETTTEVTTEAPTEKETQTEAPTTSDKVNGTSYVIGSSAKDGSYNVTANGTYGDLNFNFREIGSNYGTLRPDYSSQITFTLSETTKVSLTVSGKDAVIMGGTDSVLCTAGKTTTTELKAGSYYIVGTDANSDTKISKVIIGTEKDTEAPTEKETEKETEAVSTTGIKAGTYSAETILGNSAFTVKNNSVSNGQIKLNDKGSVSFKVADNATITVNYKCGSSNASKKAAIVLADKTSDYLAGKASSKDFTVSGLKAGTYTITAKQSGGTTAQIMSVTVSYDNSSSENTTEKATEKTTEKSTEKATEGTSSSAINITQDTITVKAGQTVSFDTVSDGDYYFEINNAGWWFEPVNGFVDVWNSHYNHIMVSNKTNTFSINTWCGLSDGYTFTITAYTADGKNSDTVKVVVTK